MKKSLSLILLLVLLAVFFVAGARFSQREAPRDTRSTADRQILHYVDPMNPAHTTKEPGIAPCGMPMEPVYAEEERPGTIGSTPAASLGAVKVNRQKQQIIGVQLGEVKKTMEMHHLRALGRIAPDENRVYTLIAATDGWLEDINESTTGSMVQQNQLLAKVKVYNYDFFSWQQRYLTELGYTNRIPVSTTPLAGADQSRRRVTSGAGYQAGLPISESEARMIRRGATISQMARDAEQQRMAEPPSSAASMAGPRRPGVNAAKSAAEMVPAAPPEPAPQPKMDHLQHMGGMVEERVGISRTSHEQNLLYSSKGRLELLNFGVAEDQLQALSESGSYITHVDLRSPVSGYVLSRNVSSLQKIDSGTECFRIADLGRVWVEVDIYDSEAKYIQAGMEARVFLPKQREYAVAKVSKILPRFDAASRSLKVRLEMDNPAHMFRPEMFVDVEFMIPMPESISVPASAVIDSGKRKTVYVVLEEGVFEPREVATGWQTSERVEITKGLQPGEQIVVSGNFLIDSESRMKLAAARLMEDKVEQPIQPQVPEAVATSAPLPDKTPIVQVEKSKDPVCGMTVRHDRAVEDDLTVEVEGKTYYFCSADCKEQFQQDPQRFLDKQGNPPPSDAPAHGGHPHD